MYTFIMALGAGVLSQYKQNNIDAVFWAELIAVCAFVFLFAILAKSLHRKTDKLKDI